MDVIHQPTEWFTSQEGVRAFASLTAKEDKTIFIFSYLRQVVNQTFPSERLVFQTAFLLADEVLGSNLPYAAYPDIILPKSNPFVAYLANGRYVSDRVTLVVFLGILHGKIDPTDKSCWIYDKECQDESSFAQRSENEDCYLYSHDCFVPDREKYAIDESLQKMQLKLIWMLSEK